MRVAVDGREWIIHDQFRRDFVNWLEWSQKQTEQLAKLELAEGLTKSGRVEDLAREGESSRPYGERSTLTLEKNRAEQLELPDP